MDAETKLAVVSEKLRLPEVATLQPWIAKLIDNQDSMIIIGIEKPMRQDGPLVAIAWLSAKERLKVRQALQRLNDSRTKKGESLTNEIPN
jgi:hypothetical protein